MRDIKRIFTITEEIKKLWLCNPDLRFFQVVELINEDSKDSFYKEDDKVLESIRKLNRKDTK